MARFFFLCVSFQEDYKMYTWEVSSLKLKSTRFSSLPMNSISVRYNPLRGVCPMVFHKITKKKWKARGIEKGGDGGYELERYIFTRYPPFKMRDKTIATRLATKRCTKFKLCLSRGCTLTNYKQQQKKMSTWECDNFFSKPSLQMKLPAVVIISRGRKK